MANVSSSNGLEKRPKLRFPGFDEPWKAEMLSDFSERVTRKNTKNETNLPLTISSKDGLVDQISYFNKMVASKDISSYYLLKEGEYAYNKSYSVGYDFGSIKRLDRYPMGALSTLYICFALKRHNSDFIRAYFDSLKWYREIYMISAEGARNHGLLNVPTEDFFQTIHYLPQDTREQRKIANFIITLDRRIDAQQSLVKSLKKYKRGALKAVFTQQVSFSAKPQKWDKYKMGDLISLQSGQDFAPAEYNDQEIGVPYMTGASCIVKGETVVSRWTQTPRCYAYKGDTLLVCKGSGSGAVVRLTQEKVHIARQFMSLRANEKMTSDFCYYLTGFLSDRIKRNATGLIEGIDRGTVLNQTVFLPPLHEQKKIARFFSKLDFTITAHENMLDTLINEITGLMQRLFI
ncbi:MAG: restriction endonuclease subunit S [Oscillospiraceae bacterium]|nr:restriction endonuclease subunit S [Oscillospiraceae bacterium]